MNKYQYKERDHAEEIVKNGFTSKYIVSELKILSKYYKEQGETEASIKELLKSFCEKNMSGYNEAVHFKIINNAVAYGMKDENKIIQISQIGVTQEELDIIENMDIDYEYKRVVFTLLVLTKLSKEYIKIKDGEIKSNEFYFGGHKNYRELISTSKITFKKTKKSTVKNIHDLIRILDEKGIVKITGNGNIKLLFMYDANQQNDEVMISISFYDVMGFYYDIYYNKNNVKQCEGCGKPVRMKSNRQEYCEICRNNRLLEQKRENWHKNKEKYKY